MGALRAHSGEALQLAYQGGQGRWKEVDCPSPRARAGSSWEAYDPGLDQAGRESQAGGQRSELPRGELSGAVEGLVGGRQDQVLE